MSKYDKNIIDGLNQIKVNNPEIKIGFLGIVLKKYLLKNNIFLYMKNKRISLNTYLKFKYNGLLNFIKLNTAYSILDKDNTKIIKFN